MYNKNKIVIFDWGGVIESHYENEYNWYTAISNIVRHFSILTNKEEIIEKYFLCDYDELGKSIIEYNEMEDVKKWFIRLKNEFNFNCSFEEFCEVYQKEFSKLDYYKDIVLLAHSLKENCKIGILSNLMCWDKKRLDKQVNLKEFDYVWLSFEMGHKKPDEGIYECVEKECNISPNNILFIDDNEENINAAKKRGWNVCLATGHELDKIKDSVNKFINT